MDKVNVKEYVIERSGKKIYGRLYTPAKEGKCPAVIISHGYNGIADDWVKECNFYAQNGYIAYAFDFCGGSVRSRSSGNTVDMTVFTEKDDLLDVFEDISSLENVDKHRIYLKGGSQGGLVTALAAEELKEKVRAVVLYFPAFCIPDNWNDKFASESEIPESIDFWGMKLGRNFSLSIRALDVKKAIGGYENPVFIIHGDNDPIVKISYSEDILKQYKKARLEVLKGEAHGFKPEAGEKAMKMVLEFMDSEK